MNKADLEHSCMMIFLVLLVEYVNISISISTFFNVNFHFLKMSIFSNIVTVSFKVKQCISQQRFCKDKHAKKSLRFAVLISLYGGA